jgi:DNA repair protein RecO (recombination protein O)
MPTYRDRGFVLKSKTLRDADRHFIVYTENNGKIVLLAKGSRRGKSKMSPHMSSFGIVEIMVARGRLIDRLAGASLITSHHGILQSLTTISFAQSFLLLVDVLTKRELPEPKIFFLLKEFFDVLGQMDVCNAMTEQTTRAKTALLFHAATAKLLDVLGFGLELQACVRCRGAISSTGNAMAILRGGVECAKCRESAAMDVSVSAITALRSFRDEKLALLAALPISSSTLRETGFIMELAALAHIENRFTALRYLHAVA